MCDKIKDYNDLLTLLDNIENEAVGKAFLTTFHKLYNYIILPSFH